MQAALLKLYLRWSKIDLLGVDAYARRTIIRLAIDGSRRPHRRAEISGEVPETDTGIVDHESALDVRAALQLIPPRQRAVLVLRFLHGLSVAATATTLRIGEGSVKSHSDRGLSRMRELLTQSEMSSDPWKLESR